MDIHQGSTFLPCYLQRAKTDCIGAWRFQSQEMSLPVEVHTLSIRGTLTVLDMVCVGFFQTTDVTSVKFEVSPLYIALIHALCHTFLTRHRQRDQLHRKKYRQKFDWHFEDASRVFFQEAFPYSWRQTQMILLGKIISTLQSIERHLHANFLLRVWKFSN